MAQSLRCTGCVPPGLVVVEAADGGLAVQITVRSAAAFSPCPVCGGHSFRVHSRYQRLLLDLPLSGHNVRLHVQETGGGAASPVPPLPSHASDMPCIPRTSASWSVRHTLPGRWRPA